MKTCRDCETEKPLDEFSPSKVTRSGRVAYCRPCARVRHREWRATNRDRIAVYSKRTHLLRTYGLTIDAYDAILRGQGGVCALCLRSSDEVNGTWSLVVDHDHETGRIRGLLCSTCNMSLHALEKYDGWHVRALAYLAQPQDPPTAAVAGANRTTEGTA